MNTEFAPQFAQLCDRLRRIPWLSNVGGSTSLALPFAHRFVDSALIAKEEIERPSWEDLTLERRNDLTSFLHKRFRNRYSGHWNNIADKAAKFLADEAEPRYLPALVHKLPGSKAAINAVQWDLLAALMEAAYADCRPPLFFAYLITVYEAGHLPVGWDASLDADTLLVY